MDHLLRIQICFWDIYKDEKNNIILFDFCVGFETGESGPKKPMMI
jgi:hypothetical protein